MPLSEYKRFMEALNLYNESYDLAFEDALADKLKDLLGADYYKNVYIPFKNKIASKVKVGEDEDGEPIMGENPDLKLKQPKYLLDTYSDNPQELKDLIANYKTKRATTTQKKIDGAKKIGENDEYVCYRITTYPAAQYYGSNTTWCITGRYKGEEERGEYYFNKYIDEEDLDGGYYFFIHKSNPRRKYALLQGKDKTINSIWSALNSPIWSAINPQLTKDRVPVFPMVKEIPELEDIYEDVDIENPEHIQDRDRKSLEHDILISCKLENAKDTIRNIKEILEGDAYKEYKFDLNNIKDEKGNTPLIYACYNDNTELAKLLIEHGADANSEDNKGNTPLYRACFKNNTEIAKLLIEHGADVNIKNKDGYTPLSMACSNDNIEVVKLLLEHGADKSVNIKDKYGYTSLYLACSHNYTEVAKLLIEHGADVNIKDTYGYTPLSMACAKNNTELVKSLLENGADVNSKDKSGYTPLIYACYDNNTELAKLLLEHGADKSVNIKDENDNTPLSMACSKNNIELIKLLIEHGADANSKGEYGRTPLIWVCLNGNTELAKLLLEHGADVDSKNEDGETPLTWACINNHTELVKLLLEHGADVNSNSKDKYKYTPLYGACSNINTELVKLLLEHGAWKDLDANSLPEYITMYPKIEDLALSYLNKNKGRNESIRLRRLYRL